ncbi:hypothetical protein K4G60_g3942 [Candida parapsilosis]|nr:hypothetical protein K4G60_g3942 [Candida parapsilosis]KAI5909417.1 hypothetical protein K4G61_g3105 [Candida parapsilosis]
MVYRSTLPSINKVITGINTAFRVFGLNHQSTGRVSTSTLVDSTSTVDIVQLTTTLESTFSRGQIVSVGFTLVTSEQDLEEQLAGWHTDDESNHISSSSGINGVSSTISLGVEVVTTTTVSGSFIQSAEDSTDSTSYFAGIDRDVSSVASLSPSALIGSLLLSKITPTRSSSSPTKYGGYPSSILEDVFESITTIGGSTTESQSSSSPGAAATSYEGTGDKDPLAHGFIYAAYDVVYPLRWDFLLTALLWIERFWICSIIYPNFICYEKF